MKATRVSMVASVSNGIHGTSVTVHTRHSEAGTVAEVCTTVVIGLLQ